MAKVIITLEDVDENVFDMRVEMGPMGEEPSLAQQAALAFTELIDRAQSRADESPRAGGDSEPVEIEGGGGA